MDGVLVHSEPYIAKAAIAMFAEKGVTVHADEFRPFVGMGEDRFLGGVADLHQVKLDPTKDKARTYQLYLDLIQGHLKPLPGVVEFVAKCRSRGLKIAVASSADSIKVEGNLHEIGLPPSTFDAIVSGSDVAKKKPAPDIFLEAARRLELAPDRCLVVEDAIAGVAAAKAAGSRCLGLTTTFAATQLSQADWVAANLAEATDEVLDW